MHCYEKETEPFKLKVEPKQKKKFKPKVKDIFKSSIEIKQKSSKTID